jgi:hypothetical protein
MPRGSVDDLSSLGSHVMRHHNKGPNRALLIKRFYDILEEPPNRSMPDQNSPAYFELAIQEIMRDIATTEIQARWQPRFIRPLRAWKLRKSRRRLAILLELAKAQLVLSRLRDHPIPYDK